MIDLKNKEFRAKLIANPNAVLGTTGVNYKIVKSTKNVINVVLPAKNTLLDVSSVSAAGVVSPSGTFGIPGVGTIATVGIPTQNAFATAGIGIPGLATFGN